jgi:DeoR/GlpR family transcriptional regulator of sugar metabolism
VTVGIQSPAMLGEARRRKVAAMLLEDGAVTIGEVQTRFGVSPMTARRDLALLAEQGVACRTHGGAVLPSISAPEYSFTQRLHAAPEAKARLAEAAFEQLSPGESIFLDASSTTYFLARLINRHSLAVRVITNSLPVLHELSRSEHTDMEVVAIGGTFRRLTHSYVGPAAVRATRNIFADRFFMSVTGVTPQGVLTDADVLEAELKRTMLQQSEASVLLLDDSKLVAHGRHAVAPIDALSLVITDGLSAAEVSRVSDLGVTVRRLGA